MSAFEPFADDPVAALLHSDGSDATGQWSYLAVSPFRVITADTQLNTRRDGLVRSGDPLSVLADELNAFHAEAVDSPAPFIGGAVGFLSYELARSIERLPSQKQGCEGPVLCVGLFDVIAAFDHRMQEAWILATGLPEISRAARQKRAEERARWLEKEIENGRDAPISPANINWTADLTRAQAEDAIRQAIEFTHAGDIFQANITQRFTAPLPYGVQPWQLFRALRQSVQSPFGAYVAASHTFHLLSASPERFLHLDRTGMVQTRPIKGSRPRGTTAADDHALAKELLESGKDRAENLMITDLMRNDLARVCEAGSVQVDALCGLETFPAIHHLVSVVSGQLRQNQTAVDLLRACFPGGSVTGAPKVRAMEIIHDLEPVARGPYCGAVVWIGFDGAMDSSIIIRSLVVDDHTVIAQAGGGIVADSNPAAEYDEAMVKIQPLLDVLKPGVSP